MPMLAGTDSLMRSIHDLFTGLYGERYSRSAFIAFEPMGLPISRGMFQLNAGDAKLSPALAVERLSEIANTVLIFDGDMAHRTERSLDLTSETLIEGALPAGTDATASVGGVKAEARRAYDGVLGSLKGASSFHPAYATPTDWYDDTVAANWTRQELSDAHSGGASDARVPPGLWRVVPDAVRPSLEQPLAQAYPMLQKALARANLPPALTAAAGILGGLFGAPPADEAASQTQGQALLAELSPALVALSAANLDAQASRQKVEATHLRVTLDYCVVNLHRPWFPERLLLLRDWYLPGYGRGEFSQGQGMDDTGLMPVVTTGFVAVRNLSIAGQWSAQDLRTIAAASSVGPFSLQGRAFDPATATLTAPGMQIIGWFCEALPVLPPQDDPATTQTSSKG